MLLFLSFFSVLSRVSKYAASLDNFSKYVSWPKRFLFPVLANTIRERSMTQHLKLMKLISETIRQPQRKKTFLLEIQDNEGLLVDEQCTFKVGQKIRRFSNIVTSRLQLGVLIFSRQGACRSHFKQHKNKHRSILQVPLNKSPSAVAPLVRSPAVNSLRRMNRVTTRLSGYGYLSTKFCFNFL